MSQIGRSPSENSIAPKWMRDQVLAARTARLLAGQDLDFDFSPSTEPPPTMAVHVPKCRSR